MGSPKQGIDPFTSYVGLKGQPGLKSQARLKSQAGLKSCCSPRAYSASATLSGQASHDQKNEDVIAHLRER